MRANIVDKINQKIVIIVWIEAIRGLLGELLRWKNGRFSRMPK